MKKRKRTITSTGLVIFLAAALIALDLLIRMSAPAPKEKAIKDAGKETTEAVKASEKRSANEIQYDDLLQKEQEVLKEIERLQADTDPEKIRENKVQMTYLEDELHGIQVLKRMLEARMEGEKGN